MYLFYAPDIKDKGYILNPEDSRHCAKVLRLKSGVRITLTDGRGSFYYAKITKADAKATEVAVEETERQEKPWPFHLHVAIAPTKNMNRTEWAIEKMIELGVDRITPLLCDHSERKTIKPARIHRIITSAVKQSLKAWYPQLEEMTQFKKFVEGEFQGGKYIAYRDEQYNKMLGEFYSPSADAVVLIGPEGDFSRDEVALAIEKGFKPVNLGKSRLRTETAAVVACHGLHMLNEQQGV